jgi:hypothetical protein
MVQDLLFCGGLGVASFAAAAVLVFALTRVTGHLDRDGAAWDRRPGPRRFRRRAEPAWWPEFERAFADYVRTGAARES